MRSMNERLATWTHSCCCLGMERGRETDRHQATPAPEASVLLADGVKVRYTQVCLDIGIPRPRGLVRQHGPQHSRRAQRGTLTLVADGAEVHLIPLDSPAWWE